ncbi:MAG: methyltransferase domain-containing protein [Candidatus Rokubacteria bacterium]|nr:methyltransferase domain-containing protein [Candidatus Rokubacteria bacterium]
MTHPDVWQRALEIDMIRGFLRPTDRVLDVGCGNGYTTTRVATDVRDIVGMDYSTEMVARARAASALRFELGDVLTLGPADFGRFDVAITERCLINLASWDEQRRALDNIASVLVPGGRLIFVEGSRQGREHLNTLRESLGLSTMPRVWHNVDFDEDATLAWLGRHFVLEERRHFGVYDFVARVVHPLVAAPAAPVYDAPINEVAARLSSRLQEFAALSRILFLVLRKIGS